MDDRTYLGIIPSSVPIISSLNKLISFRSSTSEAISLALINPWMASRRYSNGILIGHASNKAFFDVVHSIAKFYFTFGSHIKFVSLCKDVNTQFYLLCTTGKLLLGNICRNLFIFSTIRNAFASTVFEAKHYSRCDK